MTETTHQRDGEQSITHRREFAAPAAFVQRAHTEAELFAQWLGPEGSTMKIDRFDAVTGGGFDYTVQIGGDHRFFGSYHLVTETRIVHTWQYADDGYPTLEILDFIDLPDGRSALEVRSTYASKADCDAMVESGLDGGMDSDFLRLDRLLARG